MPRLADWEECEPLPPPAGETKVTCCSESAGEGKVVAFPAALKLSTNSQNTEIQNVKALSCTLFTVKPSLSKKTGWTKLYKTFVFKKPCFIDVDR